VTEEAVADAPAAAGEHEERDRIRDGVRYCLLVFLGLRLGLTLLALLGLGLVPHAIDPVSVPGWRAPSLDQQGWHTIFTAWERFDGLWFLRIATGGYRVADHSAAFFPLYPLLTRAVSFVIGGHPYAASLLVSNASFAGALVVLYFLASSELSERAARKAVLYLALFPTSLFFLAPYSEAPFLLATLGAFWGARRGRWWVAGVCGAAASATRNTGVLVAAALAIEALHQWREPHDDHERGPLWPKLAWAAAASAGTIAYCLYWLVRSGRFLEPVHQQTNWLRQGSTPWHTLWQATRDAWLFLGQYPGGYHLMDWLITVPCMALAVYALLRFRPAYGFYACASIVVPLCFIFPGRPLLSVPRFLAVLFPIHWALADLAERGRLPHHLVVGVSAAGLGALTILFVNWYYVF
jgi:hypothetical protein